MWIVRIQYLDTFFLWDCAVGFLFINLNIFIKDRKFIDILIDAHNIAQIILTFSWIVSKTGDDLLITGYQVIAGILT